MEQIPGRILRRPYAKKHDMPLFNTSYVLTCSNDFRNTLDNIVVGLNKAGFSRKDYRVGSLDAEMPVEEEEPVVPMGTQVKLQEDPLVEEPESFDDVSTEDIKHALELSLFL